jgi:Secretion system C-terminal sorting domain/HYR domain/Dockerin type I domain
MTGYAQCTLSYKTPGVNQVNLSMTSNCNAIFDASPYVTVTGANCSLRYFLDAAGALPYQVQPPFFTSALINQTVTLYVGTEDNQPLVPNPPLLVFYVTIEDNTKPKITCPSNIQANTAANACLALINDALTPVSLSDNCSPTVAYSYQLSGATTAIGTGDAGNRNFNVGTTTVKYTAQDLSQNTQTCTFSVTINENTPPTVVSCPNNITVDAVAATCSKQILTGLKPSFLDNCTQNVGYGYTLTGATFGLGTGSADSTIFNSGVTVILYTATDAQGNTNTGCAFQVTVRDVQAPQISCPADLTMNAQTDSCFAVPTIGRLEAFVSDNCGIGTLTTTYQLSGATTSAVKPMSQVNSEKFLVGISYITYKVSDAAGNTATCSAKITVQDVTPPVITCTMTNLTINAAPCTASVTISMPTVLDNCTPIASISNSYKISGATTGTNTLTPNTTVSFNIGTTILTFIAKDLAANTSTCSVTILVKENPNQAPIIDCRADTALTMAQGKCSQIVSQNLQPKLATDNCPNNLTLSYSLTGATQKLDTITSLNVGANGTTFNKGITTVRYILRDAAGNADTCTFQVIVYDAQKPILTCSPNITQTLQNQCSKRFSNLKPIATDNCGNNNLTFTYTLAGATPMSAQPIDSVYFLPGKTHVLFTVKDGASNSDTCGFNIILNETVPPLAMCRDTVVLPLDATGNAVLTPVMLNNGSQDNCTNSNQLLFSITQTKFSCKDFGLNTVSMSVKDNFNNQATCKSIVNVTNPNPNLVLTLDLQTNNESYYGLGDGSIETGVMGGLGQYSYSWNTKDTTANLSKLSVGTYQVTVTDKISSCSATGDAVLRAGFMVAFNLPKIIDTTNAIVNVPVRVQLFNNIKGFKGSIRLTSPNVGEILGVSSYGFAGLDSTNFTVFPNAVTFNWFPAANASPVTLGYGAQLFSIKIKLKGTVGMSALLVLDSLPIAFKLLQKLPTATKYVPVQFNQGSINVSTGAEKMVISGKIVRDDNVPLKGMKNFMYGSIVSDTLFTTSTGDYNDTIPAGGSITFKPTRNEDPLNGVSSIDLAIIQRHILGIQPLTSFYQRVAADVNRSGSISGIDLVDMRRLILGVIPYFTLNNSWRFIPSNFTFPTGSIIAYPETITYDNVLENHNDAHFVAIKIGDLNRSALVGTAPKGNIRSENPLKISIEDTPIEADKTYDISFNANDFGQVMAYQATLGFDTELFDYQGFRSSNKTLIINEDKVERGQLPLLWFSENARAFEEKETLFTLHFKAKQNAASLENALHLNSSITPIAGYRDAETKETIELDFYKKMPTPAQDFVLYSNQPNPFSTHTTLRFWQKEASDVTLKVYDVSGRVVVQRQMQGNAGFNEIQLSETDCPSAGIYFYALQNATQKVQGKLVKE